MDCGYLAQLREDDDVPDYKSDDTLIIEYEQKDDLSEDMDLFMEEVMAWEPNEELPDDTPASILEGDGFTDYYGKKPVNQ